jgi:signal transduction histidine kinase
MKTENHLRSIIDNPSRAVYTRNERGHVKLYNKALENLWDKRLLKTAIDAQENERQQIGLELHDNVNQILTGCLLNLGIINFSSPERAVELLEKSKEYILSAITEIRKLSHKMAPTSFDNDMETSFKELIQVMNDDNRFFTKFHFNNGSETSVSDTIRLNLYRILQEQLTNMVKYSQATNIEVSLTISGQNIIMYTSDNGVGFKTSAAHKGIGLCNIKKRVKMLSGTFTINTAPGKGCKMIVVLPLDSTEDAKDTMLMQEIFQYQQAG